MRATNSAAAVALQQTGFAKTIKAVTCWIGAGTTDDNVVEEIDVDGLGRFAQLACEMKIGRAGRRITAGMIVRTNHGGG